MISDLINFIEKCPTAFHGANEIRSSLLSNGFIELFEFDIWDLKRGNKYFVSRNGSAVMAFTIPVEFKTMQVCATHLDSPCFKMKLPVVASVNNTLQLDVERYGGMILPTWFDRPLSLAGKIVLEDNHEVVLFDLDEDVLMIPSVAIHLKGSEIKPINIQKELMPIVGQGDSFDIVEYIKTKCNIKGNIQGLEAFVYNRQKGTIWGKDKEFFSIGRIDNLECSYAMLKAITNSNNNSSLNIAAFYDNEEVGSGTKQGADSTFLEDIIMRVCDCFDLSKQEYLKLIASGFMISADNAHGYHPNYSELYAKNNVPHLNSGIVIKYNANQKYTTDGVSSAIFKSLCSGANVNVQQFYNNSNILGGSTLGNIASSHVSLRSVDIGLAQWAMHSSFETAGTHDFEDLIKVLTHYYNHYLETSAKGTVIK